MPRSSSLSEVRIFDLYFLYNMVYGLGEMEGIPLAGIIIDYIRDIARTKRTSKTFAFPILITRLLEHCGVDVEGEETRTTNNSNVLSESTLIQMGYEFTNNEWRKKEG